MLFCRQYASGLDLLSSQPVDLVLTNACLSDWPKAPPICSVRSRLIWCSPIRVFPMELALACLWLWTVFRLPRSSVCRLKVAAFGYLLSIVGKLAWDY